MFVKALFSLLLAVLLFGCEKKENTPAETNNTLPETASGAAASGAAATAEPAPQADQTTLPSAQAESPIPTAIEEAPVGSAEEIRPEDVQDAATEAQEETPQGHE